MFRAFILFTFAALALSGCGGKPGAVSDSAVMSRPLLGTWVLTASDGRPVPPQEQGRLKFFTGTHWIIVQADPRNGEVVFLHGGTYTLQAGTLVQKVEYAKANTLNLVGQSHAFKTTIEGDTLIQAGLGNRWNETWKRLD